MGEGRKVFFFEKKKQKTFGLFAVALWAVGGGTAWGGDGDQAGRDFPKTLIFDEPGIDDEVSLPTLVFTPTAAGLETDTDFELDKRLTDRLSVQINVGYSYIDRAHGGTLNGWQNSEATLKYILLSDKAGEHIASLSLIRDFGGSGASQIGAGQTSATTGALNFGQGFQHLSPNAYVQPFAITGTLGALLPDNTSHGGVPQALISASLQYSFDVLMGGVAASHLPAFSRPLIPIVEMTYDAPLQGHEQGQGFAAPGLIYAGDGFQLAAEALVPLTRASGTHVGAIAQLNISLSVLGYPILAQPIF